MEKVAKNKFEISLTLKRMSNSCYNNIELVKTTTTVMYSWLKTCQLTDSELTEDLKLFFQFVALKLINFINQLFKL